MPGGAAAYEIVQGNEEEHMAFWSTRLRKRNLFGRSSPFCYTFTEALRKANFFSVLFKSHERRLHVQLR